MATQNPTPLAIGTELHEYRIERVLGHGGFGVTYLARDRHLNAQVAIKEYLPRDFAHRTRKGRVEPTERRHEEDYAWGLDRFKREARALARFKHPNIVRVARMLEANNTAYMVMEFEVGLTLSEYLRGHSAKLSEAELLGVFLPILDGLEQLHAVDVIHRDIKPGNVYLRRNGPMLLDFGSARQMRGEGEDRELTALVTPGYAPLEQYSADERQGPWSDLYAVGASMYMCMFGAAPIDATKRSAALAEGEPDPYQRAVERGAGEYSPALLEAVDWALALRMRDRPQDAGALRQRLAAGTVAPVSVRIPDLGAHDEPTLRADTLSAAQATAVLSETQGGRPRPWWSRPRARAALAVAVVAALTAFAVQGWLAARADDRAYTVAAAADTPAAYAQYLMECTRCAHRAQAERARDELNAEIRAAAEAEARRAAAEKAAREAREAAARKASAPAARGAERGGSPAAAGAGARGAAGGAARKGPAAGSRIRDDLGAHGLGPELVVVPGGSFQMGDSTGEGERDEQPAQRVAVAAFAIGVREVSRGEFAAFVAATDHRTTAQRGGGCRVTKQGRLASDRWTHWKRGPFSQTDASPVICVSWDDARAYVAWLSETTKRRYRLPTEAEWEYAARAGSSDAWWWGPDGAAGKANCDGCGAGARERTLEPGGFPANAWGLLDVAGNVAEWTCSAYAKRYDGAERECVEPDSPRDRVLRGGSWAQPPDNARSANRGSAPAGLAADSVGFRVVAEL